MNSVQMSRVLSFKSLCNKAVKNAKLPVEVLAKITGHKTISILINTYYNPDIEELANHLHKESDPDIIPFKKSV